MFIRADHRGVWQIFQSSPRRRNNLDDFSLRVTLAEHFRQPLACIAWKSAAEDDYTENTTLNSVRVRNPLT